MIYEGDQMPCAQCDCMVDIDQLDVAGICPDCQYENGLVSDIIEDQPEWIDNLATYSGSAFISS